MIERAAMLSNGVAGASWFNTQVWAQDDSHEWGNNGMGVSGILMGFTGHQSTMYISHICNGI